MEKFFICAVQYGSHWSNVATEHMKCGYCDGNIYFNTLFDFNKV